jgi:tetratricopeptide (TPR) repeat protein
MPAFSLCAYVTALPSPGLETFAAGAQEVLLISAAPLKVLPQFPCPIQAWSASPETLAEVCTEAIAQAQSEWIWLLGPGEYPSSDLVAQIAAFEVPEGIQAVALRCQSERDQEIQIRLVHRDSPFLLGEGSPPFISGLDPLIQSHWILNRTGAEVFSATAHAPRSRFLLGLSAFRAQSDSQALQLWRTLAAEPATTFWHCLAHLYHIKVMWELRQHERALELFERYRQEQPALEKMPGLWVMMGVIANHTGQNILAVECYQKVLEIGRTQDFFTANPWSERADIEWKAPMGLGELYLQEGRFTQAYHLFQQALEKLPEHPVIKASVVRSAFLAQHLEVLPALLAEEELPGIAAPVRQALLALSGAESQAAETITTDFFALLSSPEQTLHSFSLSVAVAWSVQVLQQGYFAQARRLLEQLIVYVPQEHQLIHNLAYTYFAQRDYTQAEHFYRQAIALNPQHPESHMDLGKTLANLGRIPEAIAAFEELLKRFPQHAQAQQAIRQLQAQTLPMAVVPPLMPVAPEQPPFVFVFPLAPTWENGIDQALKAYLSEFIAEDRVIFAIPGSVDTSLVEEALHWAQTQFTPELLPPVAILSEDLPLPLGLSTWVLPYRLAPAPEVLAELQASGVPLLAPGQPLPRAGGDVLSLPALFVTNREHTQRWQEVNGASLAQLMRMARNGLLQQASASASSACAVVALEKQFPRRESSILAGSVSDAPLPLSVCMIVRDEAAMLPACLDSLGTDVAEIIVVDTGSQDNTRELAQSYPRVHLFDFPWGDNFAEARNFALAQAQSDWILTLDADEYVPSEFLPLLREHLPYVPQEIDALVFPIQAVEANGKIIPADTLPVPRCFRNHRGYAYQGRIHELLVPPEERPMQYLFLPHLPILHRGYRQEVRHHKGKAQRDLALMEAALANAPAAPDNARLYLILGQLHLQHQRLDAAESVWLKGLEVIRDDLRLRNTLATQLGVLWLQQGRPEALHSLLLRWVEPDLWLLLLGARTAALLGNSAQAFQAAHHVLEQLEQLLPEQDPLQITPPRRQVLLLLAELAEADQDSLQARYYFARALKEGESTAEDWQVYARLRQQSA